ncbi:hypothetical protein K1M91_17170, partial [Motilimonas sp. E26]|nr:hypothetical protein [Motilimonas sp. E26]
LLAKQIITLYHAAQKSIAKDQHALGMASRKLYLASVLLKPITSGYSNFTAKCHVQGCKRKEMYTRTISRNKVHRYSLGLAWVYLPRFCKK